MKKPILFLSMLLVMGSINIASAVDDPGRSSGVLRSGSTVKVLYKGDETTDVKISILNEKDEILFTEKIKKTNGFSRPYNFSNLPSGNYKIELVDEFGTRVEHVNYGAKSESRKKLSYVSRVSGTTDKFILSVPNRGEDKITVTILTNENAVLYSGEEAISGDFAKVYSMKHYVGTLKFIITDSKGATDSWTEESL